MANPLQAGMATPEAPEIPQPQQNSLQQGIPPQGAPQGPQGAPGGPPQPPAPTHVQTVIALRHFHAIIEEVQGILKDPAVGKSDVKAKIIDGTTNLVAQRMISPAQAVVQLSQVPEDPIKQRQWLQQMLQQTVQAANAVVDHHAAGNDGTADWGLESKMTHPHPDTHMDTMAALGGNYARK